MDGAWFRSPQVLEHSSLHTALSGRLVWSVNKNKIILILNDTILAVSLLSSLAFWVPCLCPLKIMVLLLSLNRFQTYCTYFVHSWLTGNMAQLSITVLMPVRDSSCFHQTIEEVMGPAAEKQFSFLIFTPSSKIRADAGGHLFTFV